MRIIQSIPEAPPEGSHILLWVERSVLAKRRWRGVAEDGATFGFDLKWPLAHGVVFYAGEEGTYAIEQQPEPVLEVMLIPRPAPVARLGWAIGNLHHPIQVTDEFIRVPAENGLRQLLVREKIPFTEKVCVFEPFAAGHRHGL